MLRRAPWSLDAAIMRVPFIQEIFQDYLGEHLLRILERSLQIRFDPVPDNVMAEVRAIANAEQYEQLLLLLPRCEDLETFRKYIGWKPSSSVWP